MAIEPDFLQLMVQTVYIESFSSYNSHAEASYNAATPYSGRTVNKSTKVVTNEGLEVVSTAKTYIYGSPTITPKDRLTLPDGTKPKILTVSSFPDENGDHHQVVYH